jgi:formate-dependent nitrite reductase membrane component NrfD/ferredoxin
MYQRDDGIVDFDGSVCIGCKACMQACPYDAIYIDPETDTAAKCHYCAHRTEIGLEPACVVICPEHAIISGDMDDPGTEISHLLATQNVTVRKPEQGTAPKLFYIDGKDVTLHPTAVERTPETFMWADVIPLHVTASGRGHYRGGKPTNEGDGLALQTRKLANSETTIRKPQAQGTPWNGPIQFGATVAEHMVQVSYNAQHKIPWHWPVPAYLVTKGIGAGIFMIMSLGMSLGLIAYDNLTVMVAGFVSLMFIGLTTALLVFDLEKPGRFISIMMRPQWSSWLARGAFILMGFTILVGLWWLLEAAAYFGILPASAASAFRPVALWVGLPLAVAVAVYTAYLFAQAEGRDLWQSPLLPVHLLIQSFMVGAAALLIIALFLPSVHPGLILLAVITFFVALILDLFVMLVGEFTIPHANEVAARASHDISSGRYRNYFWWGSVFFGHLVPLALVLILVLVATAVAAQFILLGIAALSAIIGMYLFEYAFVMAPQEIPNS